MKTGDLVRFRKEEFPVKPGDCGMWQWKLGLLIQYHTWEKIGTILCEGKLIRVRAEDIQKAGKKDESWYSRQKKRG